MITLNWNDIWILGGSMCQYRTELTHWPKLLTCLLTNNIDDKRIPEGHGFPGAAWWSTKRYLDEKLKHHTPKVLVITHAESTRIPHDDDLPLNFSITLFEHNPYKIKQEVCTAAKMYYHHLISVDFHTWAHERWFEEVDEQTKDIPITIHLLQHKDQYTFKHGITIDQSIEDLMSRPFWDQECTNHFTPEENDKFARTLYDLIKNYTTDGRIKLNW